MLETCKTALLITRDETLAHTYTDIALKSNVVIKVESSWLKKYRAGADVIICDSEFSEEIADEYRYKTVIVLNKDESFVGYRKDFDRFVFNRLDSRELVYAFLKWKKSKLVVIKENQTLLSVLKESGQEKFEKGDYMFDFAQDVYKYKDKRIYLSKSHKVVLARWFFLEYKDTNTRTQVYQMRKKFGKDFLSDINIKGDLKDGRSKN